MSHKTRALIRALPVRYAEATVDYGVRVPINTELAAIQHAQYVAELAKHVDELIWAEPFDEGPDSVFVEDQAVVASGLAVLARSGHTPRRLERVGIADALRPYVELIPMEAPCTLDGGDVLRVGPHIFVGRSARTNDAGISFLRESFSPLGYQIHRVDGTKGLHLKCVCSKIASGTVMAVEGRLQPDTFQDFVDVVWVPEEESYAANALAVGGHVMMAAGFPTTRRRLLERGLPMTEMSLSEIRKGDGALTCMSILLESDAE